MLEELKGEWRGAYILRYYGNTLNKEAVAKLLKTELDYYLEEINPHYSIVKYRTAFVIGKGFPLTYRDNEFASEIKHGFIYVASEGLLRFVTVDNKQTIDPLKQIDRMGS